MNIKDIEELEKAKHEYETELLNLKRATSLASASFYFEGYSGISPNKEVIPTIRLAYAQFHFNKCVSALQKLNGLGIDIASELTDLTALMNKAGE